MTRKVLLRGGSSIASISEGIGDANGRRRAADGQVIIIIIIIIRIKSIIIICISIERLQMRQRGEIERRRRSLRFALAFVLGQDHIGVRQCW